MWKGALRSEAAWVAEEPLSASKGVLAFTPPHQVQLPRERAPAQAAAFLELHWRGLRLCKEEHTLQASGPPLSLLLSQAEGNKNGSQQSSPVWEKGFCRGIRAHCLFLGLESPLLNSPLLQKRDEITWLKMCTPSGLIGCLLPVFIYLVYLVVVGGGGGAGAWVRGRLSLPSPCS